MKYKTASKKIAAVLLSLLIIFSLAACSSQSRSASNSDDSESQDTEADVTSSSGGTSANSNILVVYFSHTGENYSVGVIEKGNTHIIADMIAEETGWRTV